jgi:CopG family transcriptional regulator / antitoxin EndoAI
MHRRINITLPEETIRLIDRVSEKGDRSRLIDNAVRRYVSGQRRERLRKKLKEGALRRAKRDLEMADESFFLEEEASKRDSR